MSDSDDLDAEAERHAAQQQHHRMKREGDQYINDDEGDGGNAHDHHEHDEHVEHEEETRVKGEQLDEQEQQQQVDDEDEDSDRDERRRRRRAVTAEQASFQAADHRRGGAHVDRPAPPRAAAPAASSSPDDSSTLQPARNVYVENLPLPVTDTLLRNWFGPFGSVERVHIGTDRATGKQLGFAFVHFADDAQGRAAIAQMHQAEIQGKAIRCSVAKRKGAAAPAASPAPPVQHADRGYASSSSSSSAPLLGNIPGSKPFSGSYQQHPQPLLSSSSRPSAAVVPASSSSSSPLDAPPNPNIFVTGINPSWGDRELRDLFSPCGQVMGTKLLLDRVEGKSKGSGFIFFDNVASATVAVGTWHGRKPPGADSYLQVRFAHPKREQQRAQEAAMEAQAQHGGSGGQGFAPSYASSATSTAATNSSAPLISFAPSAQPSGHAASAVGGAYGPDRKARTHMGVRHDPLARGGATASAGHASAAGHVTAAYSSAAFPASNSSDSHSSSSLPPGALNSQGHYSLFVCFVPKHVDDQGFREIFSRIGPVAKVHIPRNAATGETKGYGFVDMIHEKDAHQAISTLTGYELGDRRLKVAFKTDRSAGGGSSGGTGGAASSSSATGRSNTSGQQGHQQQQPMGVAQQQAQLQHQQQQQQHLIQQQQTPYGSGMMQMPLMGAGGMMPTPAAPSAAQAGYGAAAPSMPGLMTPQQLQAMQMQMQQMQAMMAQQAAMMGMMQQAQAHMPQMMAPMAPMAPMTPMQPMQPGGPQAMAGMGMGMMAPVPPPSAGMAYPAMQMQPWG